MGGVDLSGRGCVCEHENILVQEIYCAKPNLVCMVLGTQAPRIIQEYDHTTVIEIRPLTQPLTFEMGSSIFTDMSQIKVASTTLASLTITPSTKK